MTMWILAYNDHLADVGFGLDMTFESVFIATLFFADLAVPSESLETFRLLLVCDGFGGSSFGAGHRVVELSEFVDLDCEQVSMRWRLWLSLIVVCEFIDDLSARVFLFLLQITKSVFLPVLNQYLVSRETNAIE